MQYFTLLLFFVLKKKTSTYDFPRDAAIKCERISTNDIRKSVTRLYSDYDKTCVLISD